jgi:hypothetical protein
MNKPLAGLRNKEKMQITKIRDESGDITTTLQGRKDLKRKL